MHRNKMSVLSTELFTNTSLTLLMTSLGVLVFFLGLIVLVREHGTRAGVVFSLVMTSCAGVFFAAGISIGISSVDLAVAWARVAFAWLAVLPAFAVFFATEIAARPPLLQRLRVPVAIVSPVFAALALATDWFIVGVSPFPMGYVPRYAPAAYGFLAYAGAVLVLTLIAIARRRLAAKSQLERRRLTFVLAIFIAGTLSLPTYAPGTTPALHMSGLVPFLISIFVLTYVVLRYRFVDITPSIAAHQILHTMQSAVVVADMEGTIQIANGVAERLINLGSERLEGVSMRVILERVEDTCAESEQEEGIPYDVTLTQFDGSQRVLNVSRTSLRDRHGLLIGSVYVARDVTEVRRTERKLRQMALYDALTGLPNRVLFFDRLNQILARARRTGEQVAILFIDLDRFKSINDLYGHETGDTLLRETAERMVSCTRATDTIARVGGDEFIGICESISSPEDVDHIAGKIVEVLVRPFVIDGQSMNIGVSIGISIFPQDGIDQRALLAHADEAMYSVKSSRRSGFRLYSELVAERELPG